MRYAAPFEVLESPFLNEEIVSRSVEEEVLGKDHRTLVGDTLKVPHRWICAIDVMSENPKWGSQGQPRFVSRSRATGILIGPRHVLTARHVFPDRDDAAATQHTISPARNGSNSNNPFGKVKAASIHRSQPYFIRRRVRQGSKIIEIPLRQHDDYALVILEKDIASSTHAKIAGALGYWGLDSGVAVVRRLDPAALQNKDIAVTGYPGDTCAKSRFTGTRSAKDRQIEHCWNRRNDEWASTQWTAVGTLAVEADSTTLFHTADTYDGQSGAPICMSVDGQLHLVGVHTAPDNAQRNRGVRVTRRMLRELCEWINADAGYIAATVRADTLTLQPPGATASHHKAAEASLEFDALELDELEFDDLEFDVLESDETPKAVGRKLKITSFPSHVVEVKGSDTTLTPASMDPGIYDGPKKYKAVAGPGTLQNCLTDVMKQSRFSHIKAALVDLTKSAASPDFAGFNHKSQVFAASVPKMAAMLGAFQLRHDLRAALKSKGSKAKTLAEFFPLVRASLAGARAAPYPKAPELERIVADVKAGSPLAIEFRSTGETKDQLEALINDYNATSDQVRDARKALVKAKGKAAAEKAARTLLADAQAKFAAAKAKVGALGFLERLRVTMGGRVPASNFATGTIVRDIGFVYIASTLVQSGLHDNERNGGIWLALDYAGTVWTNGLALGNGISQSATAGSAAAFMTLMAQGRLVSPAASAEMRALMKKEPNPTHPGIVSWFKQGLMELKDQGSIKQVLSKLGAFKGIDDCALIEREVGPAGGRKTLRYIAVGLRGRNRDEMKSLIRELDKCILANNKVSAADGGHS